MPSRHVLDRAELRLQGHRRLEVPVARRAHRRVRLVAIQPDARAGQLEMDLRPAQRGRRIGKMADLRRNAGLFHTRRERLEVLDLPVRRRHELGHVRAVGHRQMAPLPDDMEHTLLRQRHQLRQSLVEGLLGEPVAAESGIDLHMHAGRLAEPAGRGGHRIDARQRPDRHVDVLIDQLVERHFHAVIYPCQYVAAVRPDAEPAQQQRLVRLRGAQPRRAAGERRQRSGHQAMPVRVGLDHAHHGRARIRAADDIHQVPHVVAHGGEVYDRLCRVAAAGRLIVRLADRG